MSLCVKRTSNIVFLQLILLHFLKLSLFLCTRTSVSFCQFIHLLLLCLGIILILFHFHFFYSYSLSQPNRVPYPAVDISVDITASQMQTPSPIHAECPAHWPWVECMITRFLSNNFIRLQATGYGHLYSDRFWFSSLFQCQSHSLSNLGNVTK